MPRIEHVALWVDDIDRICAFYEEAFGAHVGALYANTAKGFESRFLSFDSGARIEVMSTSKLSPVRHLAGAERMGLTHLALSFESEDAVRQVTERLKAKGTVIIDGPRRTGDGYYESVILDPEGNRIELTA